MPISRILKHARESRRFDLEAVASFTKISADRLVQFEAGQRAPSYQQLQKLGEVYGVPPYVFSSRDLPNLTESIPDFRKKAPQPAQLSPAGMRKIFSAEGIAAFAHQLAIELKYQPRNAGSLKSNSSVNASRARDLRGIFDDWFGSRRDRLQFSGSEDQVALSGFRLFLETEGLLVTVNDAPEQDFLGFYLDEEHTYPLAFVNRSILSKKAQLFTLAHELSHHIMGQNGVSSPFIIRNDIERRCNKFAAEFLAPLAAFKRLVDGFDRHTKADISALITEASKRSLLSKHATALRLVEAEFINANQYVEWRKKSKFTPRAEKVEEAEEIASGGGNPHAKRIGELGYISTYLAKKAVEKKIIDPLDVQSGMGLSVGLQQKAFSLVERRFEIALAG